MGRKQPLGRKHKAGTGNFKYAPAARIISKVKVSGASSQWGALSSSQVRGSLWLLCQRAVELVRFECMTDFLCMCQVQSAPRPPAPDRYSINGYGHTVEEAVANLKPASCMCHVCRWSAVVSLPRVLVLGS